MASTYRFGSQRLMYGWELASLIAASIAGRGGLGMKELAWQNVRSVL